MTEALPYLLSPSRSVFRPRGTSKSGGRTLSGDEFVVVSDAGFWTASLQLPVHGEDRTLAYRSLIAALNGRAGTVLVPCLDRFRPRDYNGRMPSAEAATGIDGLSLLDHGGIGFVEEPTMWVSAAASRRASRLLIRHPHVDSIRPGHYFGLGERLHVVSRQWAISSEYPVDTGALFYGAEAILYGLETITYGDPEAAVTFSGENVSAIDIWPPLREAVAAETPLILGRPVCKMRLASDDEGALEMEDWIVGRPAIEFEEAF